MEPLPPVTESMRDSAAKYWKVFDLGLYDLKTARPYHPASGLFPGPEYTLTAPDGTVYHLSSARGVVERVYAEVDRALWPAAEASVRAQLAYLESLPQDVRWDTP